VVLDGKTYQQAGFVIVSYADGSPYVAPESTPKVSPRPSAGARIRTESEGSHDA
jgi:hypothetical protein